MSRITPAMQDKPTEEEIAASLLGRFQAWASEPCPKCSEKAVRYRIVESSCGGYESDENECCACGHSWWADGPDA
jgi:DNA-directed RNA polymerase subunit M/transcription elongation factor TFIIS